MERPRFVKLVRDKIGRLLGGEGRVFYEEIEPGSPQHIDALRAKLLEEVGEYLREPTIAEAADVLAVLQGLAKWDLRCAFFDVQTEATAKAQDRGDFMEPVGMFVTTTASQRHG